MKTKRYDFRFILLLFFITTTPIHAQDVVNDLLIRTNNLRASLGLSSYSLNTALSAAADNQARWMAATQIVSHTQDNGTDPVDRALASGYASSWVAENIYMEWPVGSVDDAWNFWINSSIHYAGLTSESFKEIGIGTATSENGQAFVLVFGNPGGGRGQRNTTVNNGSNNNAREAPQLAILGFDSVGNVRYQLQEGETLGDVLLIFGYTWDDLPTLLQLNSLTDADLISLDVGQEILVPPHSGTWTPTPAEVTEITPNFQITASLSSSTITEREILQATQSAIPPTLLSPTNSQEEIIPPIVVIKSSPTDMIEPNIVSTAIMPINTALPENPLLSTSSGTSIPPWIIGAIAIQSTILIFASFEMIKRNNKKGK